MPDFTLSPAGLRLLAEKWDTNPWTPDAIRNAADDIERLTARVAELEAACSRALALADMLEEAHWKPRGPDGNKVPHLPGKPFAAAIRAALAGKEG